MDQFVSDEDAAVGGEPTSDRDFHLFAGGVVIPDLASESASHAEADLLVAKQRAARR